MKKSKTIYIIVASFIAMLILAITESIRGILIPTFKIDFNVSDTQIGLFLLLGTLAFVVSTHFAGKAVKNFGQKHSAILGMTISGLGFLGTSFSQSFLHLVIGYIILTVGISFLVMSLNTIVPLLKVSYLAVVMNSLHFFYGVGSAVTQRVSGFLITSGVSWRTIFVWFSVLYLFGIIVYSFVEQPEKKIEETHKSKIKPYEIKLVVFFCLALGFYIAAEVQTATWLINYLNEVYSYNENNASRYLSFFFVALSVGRLFGGYVLERIGYIRGIIISLAIALILYSVGLFSEKTLMFLSISGLFFSIVYPTIILILQKYFHENVTRVLSIVTMAGSAVSMTLGFFIGFLNDRIGVVKSFYLIPISILISLIFVIGIYFEELHVERKRLEE